MMHGDGRHAVTIEQGVEMGRSSQIELELEIAGSSLTRVRLAGHAVRVAEGSLFL